MRRSVIVKAFWGGLIGLAVGTVLLLVAAAVAVGNNVFLLDGPDVVGVRSGAATWTSLTLAIVAVMLMVGAAIAQFIAWLGAVVRTADRPEKTWFVVLLVAGLTGLGLLATLAYVITGPDRATDFVNAPTNVATSAEAREPVHSGTPTS